MNKPFLTIDEQIRLLNSRGVITDATTGLILLSEGYYSVVNGYKTPFLDAEASAAANDDRYLSGTHFNDIYTLFLFDRELREITFHYLTKVETLLKTTCAYRFSEAHQSRNAYLDVRNYATEDEYIVDEGNYQDDLQRLLSMLRAKAMDRHNKHEYVVHYRDQIGHVPLWVLSNDLSFGNVEHFFDLMKPDEQKSVCRDIVTLTKHLGDRRIGYFHPRRARLCIETMVKFRNLCAHDERLYCARLGQHHNIDYVELIARMFPFLTPSDYEEFIANLTALLNRYAMKSDAMRHVVHEMGVVDIEHK